MARECPAVMQSPFHYYIFVLSKPIEEHLNIDVVTMHVVKMHYIGLNLIQLLQKPTGSQLRVKACLTVKSRLQHVQIQLRLAAEVELVVVLSGSAATPHAPALIPQGPTLLGDLAHDGSGRAVRHAIDGDVSHG